MGNVGALDRTLRVLIGLIALYLAFNVSAWFWILVIIGLVTGILGVCPLYKVFGICTACPTKKEETIKRELEVKSVVKKPATRKTTTKKKSVKKATKKKSSKKTTSKRKTNKRKTGRKKK